VNNEKASHWFVTPDALDRKARHGVDVVGQHHSLFSCSPRQNFRITDPSEPDRLSSDDIQAGSTADDPAHDVIVEVLVSQ
jgi:hypothetical protein